MGFSHHPPFEVTVGPDPMHFKDQDSMDRPKQSLAMSDRVLIIASGHVHRSTIGEINGISAVVASSVATPVRWDDCPAHMSDQPYYTIHRYEPEWGFTSETRLVDCTPPPSTP